MHIYIYIYIYIIDMESEREGEVYVTIQKTCICSSFVYFEWASPFADRAESSSPFSPFHFHAT